MKQGHDIDHVHLIFLEHTSSSGDRCGKFYQYSNTSTSRSMVHNVRYCGVHCIRYTKLVYTLSSKFALFVPNGKIRGIVVDCRKHKQKSTKY